MRIWAAGVPVRGRTDLIDSGHNQVIDFKTCKSFRYILTPDEIATHPQMIIYAKYALAMELVDDDQPVLLTHAYVRTDGATDHRLVTAQVSKEDVQSGYLGVERTVDNMLSTATARTYRDVPMNREACSDFGGCPYAETCEVKPAVPIRDVTGAVISLAERLKVARGINPPDANYYPEPTPAPETAPAPEKAVESAALDLELYVDCIPRKGVFAHMDDLIALRAGPICTAAGVTDVREIEFGKGTAALMASFQRHPPKGAVVAKGGPLCAAVIEVLAPMARQVVYGI